MTSRAAFTIGGVSVPPGRRHEVGLLFSRLVTGSDVSIPVMVLHGRRDGPTVWLDAAIHGDEVCGVEIIRRVLKRIDVRRLSGTVIAVPIVNVHGFMSGDRYLPDRRDLNRSFPGNPRGSLAGRIAHLMMTEIVERSSVGIDLHTGSDHRSNLSQVRADLDDDVTRSLATTFGAPVMIHAQTRDGSLRHAAREVGARVLLYETGEAWRFDEQGIVTGVEGVLRVLSTLEMFDGGVTPRGSDPLESRRTRWVRATRSGILHLDATPGQMVTKRDRLGVVYDAFGHRLCDVRSATSGIVIGCTQYPLVTRGDALVHVAEVTCRPE